MSSAARSGAPGRVGIDIGGTFTDTVLEIGGKRFTRKLLTTSANPSVACMETLDGVIRDAGASPSDIEVIIHGTTLATNAIIERKGAITSLVTTRGFRDTIEIGTEGRPEQYDINIVKPEPLVPRRRRLVVAERMDSEGNALIPLTEQSLNSLLPALDASGTESLAIAFLHSYVNPVHEQMARDFFANRRPDWKISISSEVSPEFREFERFSTTCANAYVQPMVERYLTEFDESLKSRGFSCPLLLMLSNGGLTAIDTARRFPVRLIESGPAGGAIFSADIAKRHKLDRAVSFDMGGTTAKICLLNDGHAQTSRRFEVARVYRFRKDSGLPLRIPVIDMVEIGAGGGSIAGIDELGRITVGPVSAGSDPGPACYGLGGLEPTVTDANLAMGRIDAEEFAGGTMPLDLSAASLSLSSELTVSLGLSATQTAFAITETVCENMASASRVHAIESGKNVDDRTMVAFGGAAPLHACQLADKLGISRIIIPSDAGVGSAVGFLRAPIAYEVVRTIYQSLENFDVDVTNKICAEMESAAKSHILPVVGPSAPLTVRRQAFMRYRGQGHEIAVDVPPGDLAQDAATVLQELFDSSYRMIFGRNVGGIVAGEIVSWSVAVSSPVAESRGAAKASPRNVRSGSRQVFDTSIKRRVAYRTIARRDFSTGETIKGPAVIHEDQTSIIVTAGFDAVSLPGGDVELTRTNDS